MPPSSSGSAADKGISTDPPHYDIRRLRRARAGRRAFLGLLLLFLIAGAATLLGSRTSSVSTTGGGYILSIQYPQVTRPGLAIRYVVTVRHPGGFPAPIKLATTSEYLAMFDQNSLDPQPSAMTTNAEDTTWTFDTFDGDIFQIYFDARTEPARETGATATTTLSVKGQVLATLHYRTWVMP